MPTEPAVVSNGERVWILGGKDPRNASKVLKTSLTSMFGDNMGYSSGPTLPVEMAFHCAVHASNGIIIHDINSDTFRYDFKLRKWIEVHLAFKRTLPVTLLMCQ